VIVRRTSKLVAFVAFFLLTSGIQVFAGEEPLDKLIARAEAGGDKQSELYVDVARRYLFRRHDVLAHPLGRVPPLPGHQVPRVA